MEENFICLNEPIQLTWGKQLASSMDYTIVQYVNLSNLYTRYLCEGCKGSSLLSKGSLLVSWRQERRQTTTGGYTEDLVEIGFF